jgi:DNA repair protein RadC
MQLARSLVHTRYKLAGETTEQDVLAAAESIPRNKFQRQGSIGTPTDANEFLRMRLGALLHEEFHVLLVGQPSPYPRLPKALHWHCRWRERPP